MSDDHSTAHTTQAGPSSLVPKPRPSKIMPPCKYYKTDRGCYTGQNCRFLHDTATPPREESKSCIFFARGFCARGDACWYKHVSPDNSSSESEPTKSGQTPSKPAGAHDTDDDVICGICFEKPIQFGLLSGCSHPFCLKCLRDWRATSKKDLSLVESNVIKTCPLCRAESNFITPSTSFIPHTDPRRTQVTDAYKSSMAKVPCKYFAQSRPGQRFCPYGDDCFYKHEGDDGKPYKFSTGADILLPAFKARQARIRRERIRRQRIEDIIRGRAETLPYDDEDDPLDLFAGGEGDDDDEALAATLEILGASARSSSDGTSSIYRLSNHDEVDHDGDDDEGETGYDWDLTLEDLVDDLYMLGF